MTLDAALRQKLADWRPGEGRQLLAVPDEGAGWSAAVTADRSDVLGCLVWELNLQRSTPFGPSPTGLRDWADRAARKVTSLLEPLTVLEVDAGRNEALLRSQEPAQRGEDLFYYEVLLKGAGSALVRRFKASRQPETRREQVTYPLTHEGLVKLAVDLTAEE